MNSVAPLPFHWCISLGGRCQIAGQVRLRNLARAPGPFDWAVASASSLIQVLDNDFSGFLRRDRLVRDGEHLRDLNTGMGFRHELPMDETRLDQEFDTVRAKLTGRIADFRRHLSSPEPVLLLRIGLNRSQAVSLLEVLERRYGQGNWFLVVIHEEPEPDWCLPRLALHRICPLDPPDWHGTPEGYTALFNRFPVRVDPVQRPPLKVAAAH